MKILCVLYDDPKTGMPKDYPLAQIPKLSNYPDGSSLPTTQAIDFRPGELLGCVSGELGLRKFLEELGHELVVTSDKDGDGCKAEQELIDADIVISPLEYSGYTDTEIFN
ncbi:NAD-dependent formate dehydrogenase, partial [Francisella tularensis subsp. mediasiatica]|nr:NAD-dependent formate dehydrogenase [Francisella tularensis subsp. mediasiatica]MBK2103881.1 NAD-dependent formate dehydrogenase [Francisella tularensis subsp. mediasiatica]